MELSDIRDMIQELSGSGKRVAPGARRHGIYSSFTLPGLDDMEAVRDTRQRFADYEVPEVFVRENLVSVIDVGSNVGAVAFEFARRGCHVTGVEYREDRVALCRAIAERWELPCRFFSGDLHVALAARREGLTEPEWISKYDVVWCSSVDEYIGDKSRPDEREARRLEFYRLLRALTKDDGVCYLESNLQEAESKLTVEAELGRAGFDVTYIGNGHSGGIARKRKLFVGRPR